MSFIYIGIAATFLVLVATVVWNYVVLADIARPKQQADVTVDVTGRQWWWQVRYKSADPARSFTTANEIHIPVGRPVRVELTTTDVIHSFWVPALTGKTDTIPGQINLSWLQADRPGVYRGQCTEYCGQQHAHMAFVVVADPPDQFKMWWDHQLEPRRLPTSESEVDAVDAGEAAFMRRCAVCHRIGGTPAAGIVGPDLSHLMSRHTLAAGTLPTAVGYLAGWISDPQHIKPGNLMPTLPLAPQELSQLVAFLKTLQ